MQTTKKKLWQSRELCMGTKVQMKVATTRNQQEAMEGIEQAFAVFRQVEQACSRFDEESELRQICMHIGEPVPVSKLLFEIIRFALEVSKLSDGVFDPTIGITLEKYGFNQHYLTGEVIEHPMEVTAPVHFHDVVLNEQTQTVLLRKPLLLDLGAVAKGFAVDLAVKELQHFEGFFVNAGGDIYARGLNEQEHPWSIGIQHPLQESEIKCKLQITNAAICTSGSYERISPIQEQTHHLIDPFTKNSSDTMMSCTVIAPFAMIADAFSTVAFLLGEKQGTILLEELELEGLWIDTSLHIHMTKGMEKYIDG